MRDSYKAFLQEHNCKNLKELKNKLGKRDALAVYADFREEQRRGIT